jgi:hypothetical protein
VGSIPTSASSIFGLIHWNETEHFFTSKNLKATSVEMRLIAHKIRVFSIKQRFPPAGKFVVVMLGVSIFQILRSRDLRNRLRRQRQMVQPRHHRSAQNSISLTQVSSTDGNPRLADIFRKASLRRGLHCLRRSLAFQEINEASHSHPVCLAHEPR